MGAWSRAGQSLGTEGGQGSDGWGPGAGQSRLGQSWGLGAGQGRHWGQKVGRAVMGGGQEPGRTGRGGRGGQEPARAVTADGPETHILMGQ